MRLITKSIVYYLLIGLPLLVLAALLSYYFIRTEVRDGTDETLEHEKQNAFYLIRELDPSALFYLSSDSLSKVEPLTHSHAITSTLRDSSLFDRSEKEKNNYRILSCYYSYHEKTYLVVITKPLFEEEELVEGLVLSLFLILGFVVAAFFIVNLILAKTLWKPFNKTLAALGNYKLTNQHVLSLEKTNITEFQLLNDALINMTEKIHRDYQQQKEFTENASHELQTPLAIIKAKLYNLFQSPNLKEEEFDQLQAIEKTVGRLSLLNKALLLLTKIENEQFTEIQELDISALAAQLMDEHGTFYEAKNITVRKHITTAKSIRINPQLAELLIGNLVKNAFRHNIQNGEITLEITEGHFSISNAGNALSMPTDELFNRFTKNDPASDSLGLGLSIVKSIVNVCGYSIHYDHKHNRHYFIVNFN